MWVCGGFQLFSKYQWWWSRGYVVKPTDNFIFHKDTTSQNQIRSRRLWHIFKTLIFKTPFKTVLQDTWCLERASWKVSWRASWKCISWKVHFQDTRSRYLSRRHSQDTLEDAIFKTPSILKKFYVSWYHLMYLENFKNRLEKLFTFLENFKYLENMQVSWKY